MYSISDNCRSAALVTVVSVRLPVDPRPHDCADVQRFGFHYSGIYTVHPAHNPGGSEVEVFCDLNTDGGGWLVVQRRQDGSQRFDLPWSDYKAGFGRLAKEFWLGTFDRAPFSYTGHHYSAY